MTKSPKQARKQTRSAAPKHATSPADRRAAAAKAAARHLKAADPRLAAIIEQVGPHRPIITPDPFESLLGAIVHQQVSMQAAKTIYGRVADLCPRRRVSPRAIAACSPDQLRSAGLSRQKVRYVHDLSEYFASGRLTRPKLRKWDDQTVLQQVTEVAGIGRWTAEMLLIFCLERPDVWPIDDLGIKKAVQRFLGRSEFVPTDEMVALAEPWRPYRSYATWYLWRSLEGPLMPGISLDVIRP